MFLSAAEGLEEEIASILTLLKHAASHPLERKESLVLIWLYERKWVVLPLSIVDNLSFA